MNRKFLSWTMAAAVMAFAAGLSACDGDEEEPTPGPSGDPSLTLTDDGAATDTSIKFTIVPENAEKVAYMVIKDGEEVPDAETLLQKGKKGTASKERTYTESNLEPKTAYVVAAVAAAGEKVSEVKQVTITTADKVYVPTVTLTEGTARVSMAIFTIEVKDADKAAFVCVKKGTTVPQAADILSKGTAVDVSKEQLVELNKLDADSEYIVAAAASRGESVSAVKELTIRTYPGGISSQLTALVGEWTASMKIRYHDGVNTVTTRTKDITFPVTISTGPNDWTEDLCAMYNAVVCEGIMTIGGYSVDELMKGGFNKYEASDYYGPKWFITFVDGKLIVANGYNVADAGDDESMCVGYLQLTNNEEYVNYILGRTIGGGEKDSDLVGAFPYPVEVSGDGNTITVKAIEDEGNIFYPMVAGFENGDISAGYTVWLLDKDNSCAVGASDIVLTRKSSGAAPMSAAMNYTSVGSIPTYALDKSVVSFGQYSASTAARLK